MNVSSRGAAACVQGKLRKVKSATCTKVCHSENLPLIGMETACVVETVGHVQCRQMTAGEDDMGQDDLSYTVMRWGLFEIRPSMMTASSPTQQKQFSIYTHTSCALNVCCLCYYCCKSRCTADDLYFAVLYISRITAEPLYNTPLFIGPAMPLPTIRHF